jgi:hypothetical protein
MARTKDQSDAIKKRQKLAEVADPMAEPELHTPKEGTSAWFYYRYGQAYARGMTRASGRPFTPPTVAGPLSIMVQLLRTHCRGDDGKTLRGESVIDWIENVACDFRTVADEREYGRGHSAWSPAAFARWLDSGRPKLPASSVSRGSHSSTTAPERRAHITIKKL